MYSLKTIPHRRGQREPECQPILADQVYRRLDSRVESHFFGPVALVEPMARAPVIRLPVRAAGFTAWKAVPTDASDPELVRRTRAGDLQAEEALFRKHAPYISQNERLRPMVVRNGGGATAAADPGGRRAPSAATANKQPDATASTTYVVRQP